MTGGIGVPGGVLRSDSVRLCEASTLLCSIPVAFLYHGAASFACDLRIRAAPFS